LLNLWNLRKTLNQFFKQQFDFSRSIEIQIIMKLEERYNKQLQTITNEKNKSLESLTRDHLEVQKNLGRELTLANSPQEINRITSVIKFIEAKEKEFRHTIEQCYVTSIKKTEYSRIDNRKKTKY